MHDELSEFISSVTGPASLLDLTRAFLASHVLPQDYRDDALFKALEQDLRKCINRDRSSDGTARLVSVPGIDPETGEATRVYKQLDLFDREDYRRVWWEADAREEKARQRKRSLERHHDGRAWPDGKRLREVIHGGSSTSGAA
ncbi:MAG TPA: hypothetical protein VNH11_24725 [Pirellulales bacterium]|nr:hypothetical protein [Pirellulales bacterium]